MPLTPGLRREDRKPGESSTQLGVRDVAEPAVEGFRLLRRERLRDRRRGRRRERQRPLDEEEPGDQGASEEQVDALDHQRRAVLQVERNGRRDVQLQGAVTTQSPATSTATSATRIRTRSDVYAG